MARRVGIAAACAAVVLAALSWSAAGSASAASRSEQVSSRDLRPTAPVVADAPHGPVSFTADPRGEGGQWGWVLAILTASIWAAGAERRVPVPPRRGTAGPLTWRSHAHGKRAPPFFARA